MNKLNVTYIIVLIFSLCFCGNQLSAQNECNFQIEVGEDLSLDQGETFELNGLVSIPLNAIDSINWSPNIGLSCEECFMPTVTGTENICYSFLVTDTTSCTLIDTICIFVNPTILNQIEEENVIQLYPNPVSQQLNIETEISILKNISIYNLNGKLLLETESFDKILRIDISQLPSNIYYVRISTDQFNIVEKIVKN